MLEFNNFIVRDDFYDKYCNLEGIGLYIGAIIITAFICWSWKSWL